MLPTGPNIADGNKDNQAGRRCRHSSFSILPRSQTAPEATDVSDERVGCPCVHTPMIKLHL